MNADFYSDILIIFLAALAGGVIGGAVGAVLSRQRRLKAGRNFPRLARRQPAKVIPFPRAKV